MRRNTELKKYFIANIRKSLDIVMKDDTPDYQVFHYKDIDIKTYQSIKNSVVNFGKRSILKLSGQTDNIVPVSSRSTLHWDGIEMVVGTIKKYRRKWNTDKWLSAVESLLREPERLPFNKEENSHIDIVKIKKFLSHLKYK